ncbi:TPR-like protein, partial [Rhizodiscina lignyota]
GSKPPRKRRRAQLDTSHKFKELQGKATEAYLQGDYAEADKFVDEAMKEDPEVFVAYSLRSEIFLKLGRTKDALTVLLHGSALTNETEALFMIAERLSEVVTEIGTPEWENLKILYTRIVYLDPEHVDARLKRMEMYARQEHYGFASRDCFEVLKVTPWDTFTLQELPKLASRSGRLQHVPEVFEDSINYFKRIERKGGRNWMDLSTVNVYMDVMLELGLYEQGVIKLRQLARWLLGRENETYWDNQSDDREWDIEDEPRRIKEAFFTPGQYKKDSYGEGLPLEMRTMLGIFRLHMGPEHLEEAKHHFSFLNPDDRSENSQAMDYHDLFVDVGDAFRKRDNHIEALRFYEACLQVPDAGDVGLYESAIECYRAAGRLTDAIPIYEALLKVAKKKFRVQIDLARLYETLGDKETAAKIAEEVWNSRPQTIYQHRLGHLLGRADKPYDADEVPEAPDGRLLDPSEYRRKPVLPGPRRLRPQPYLSHIRPALRPDSTRALNPDTMKVVQDMFTQLKELQPEVDAEIPHAEAEWMRIAEFMIEQFASVDKLYPNRDKFRPFAGFIKKSSKGDWTSDTIPDDYSNVRFDEWVEIFCRLALLQAKLGKKIKPSQEGDNAHPFVHNEKRMAHIHNMWLACALIDNDEHSICLESRHFINKYKYQSDAYKLYSAANRLFSGGSRTWLNSGPNQKWILRQLKAADYALLSPEQRMSYLFTGQERKALDKVGGNPENIEELDPTLLTLYAHVMLAGGMMQNALYYYFRALALAPEDPILHLCISNAFIDHAFKRLNENRTYFTQQGVAFMMKYYDLRTRDGIKIHIQEAEFNVARMWHYLGLVHLALPRYEKVLEMHEEVEKEQNEFRQGRGEEAESFAAEAAYALSTTLTMSSDVATARRLREKWMVI